MPPNCRSAGQAHNGKYGMAAGVVHCNAEGKERFHAAHVVVFASNGVGTLRLLLNSISGWFPKGVAYSSGLVGKT
jgi:hypothetical protein